MKIVVIEDDPNKLRKILQTIQQVPGCTMDDISVARDQIEAKTLLKQYHFDLMILDLALPERADSLPSPEGGIGLLKEIVDRDIFLRPREIVGLTAYEEMRDSASPLFAEDLWDVVLYDEASESWAGFLIRKIKHIQLALRPDADVSFRTDLCIVTALGSPEMDAVLALPWQWQIEMITNDGAVYHRGSYTSNGCARSVVACIAPRMGMAASAVVATKLIYTYRPRYVAMVGILAGVKGSCELGDVVAVDVVWDWGSGKHYVDGGAPVFAAAPSQLAVSSYVRGRLIQLGRTAEVWERLKREWPGEKPATSLSMHFGPIASGAAVLADDAIMESIRQQHRKILGIEMEMYGVFSAVDDAPVPAPRAIGLKSVCDFADQSKDDRYQKYAAYTSARALQVLMEEFIT